MVFEDQYSENKSPSQVDTEPYHYASPFDRVAAFVVDYFVILGPTLYFLFSPLKKKLVEAVFLGDNYQAGVVVVVMVSLSIVALLAYQTLSLYYWAGTPGKRLFKIKVIPYSDSKTLNLYRSLLRSAVWLLECFIFMLPHLAIFSHRNRRPIHDRVAETIVVSEKGDISRPHPIELTFARGMYSTLVFMLAVAVGLPVFQIIKGVQDESEAESASQNEVKCNKVTAAMGNWLKAPHGPVDRLQLAMTLYAGSEVDEDCLKKEVHLNLPGAKDLSLNYFAQSLIHANNQVVSDKYLESVCAQNEKSDACTLSRLIDSPSENNWKNFKLSLVGTTNDKSFLKIWAIRHGVRNNEFDLSLKLSEEMTPFPMMSDFFSIVRTKSLWGLKQFDKAGLSAKMSFESLASDKRDQLAGWMCFHQISTDCKYAKDFSCQHLGARVDQQKILLMDPINSLALIKVQECVNQPSEVDYNKLARQSLLADVRVFLLALSSQQRSENEYAEDVMMRLIRTGDLESDFSSEVMSRLLTSFSSRKHVRVAVKEAWFEAKPSLNWQRVGQSLVKYYYYTGAFELVSQIGERLVGFQDHLDPDVAERVIAANYKAQHRYRAKQLAHQFLPGRTILNSLAMKTFPIPDSAQRGLASEPAATTIKGESK